MTALVFTADLQTQAVALLEHLKDYPSQTERQNFYPSLLRYKLKPKGSIKSKDSRTWEYEGVGSSGGDMMSKVVDVSSVKTWYDDDDWVNGDKRLGASTAYESKPRKETIQKRMDKWCKAKEIREHVAQAVSALTPDLDPPLSTSGYGVKFDLYTNRIFPPWHQDWDDGHALFVGLMNISRNGSVPISVKGTELLDFTGEASSEQSVMSAARDAASPLRQKLMQCRLYDTSGIGALAEDQPFGEIRWFNDAVLVHRTPPYAANTLQINMYGSVLQSFDLQELNQTFSTAKQSFNMPMNKVSDKMKSSDIYDLDGTAAVAQRALLRITVRERRKSKKD